MRRTAFLFAACSAPVAAAAYLARPRLALQARSLAARRAVPRMEDEGHDGPAPQASDAEEQAMQAKVAEHQREAARLSNAEEARSLVAYSSGYGVLSTLSSQHDGYPSGAVVGFAPDARGLPVFCFSSLSSHTRDLDASCAGSEGPAKAALTVTASGFEGAADGRVTLVGDVERVPSGEESLAGLRETYKKLHPDAFWVDFGDFAWYRMSGLVSARFVGGFARAASLSSDDYLGVDADPIAAFAKPVIGHMNADHSSSTAAMVSHYIGLDGVEKATLTSLDRLGMGVLATRNGQQIKLRLPFPREAKDRKDVKTLIVEMTKAAAPAE